LRPNEDEIQLLRLKLEEAQCKNRVIEEEMLNLKSKLTVDKTEKAVGDSDPEDTDENDQEAKAKALADQEDHLGVLKRKYDHAKRIIHELSRHEQLLAVQLRERDQEYNSHLRLLKQRVHQLEDELATTQKFAGIPVRLPYGDQENTAGSGSRRDGQLSPPELLKQPPIIPEPVLKNTQLVTEEISEDMASAKEELDQAVPFHTLLDVSANKSKAELAHKGILSQRQRPSQEALRATVLRKSVSTLSNASDSGFPVDSCEDTRENTPDSDSGYVGSVVTVTSTSRTFPPNNSNSNPSSNIASKSIVSPPAEVSKPSFLSEIQNAQRRRGLETTSSMASVTPNGANTNAAAMAVAANSSTLADQLRNRLEERRKSKDEEQVFVPDAIAADIQKAVKMANDNKPTDAGIIPPQFRKPSLQNSSVVSSSVTSPSSNHASDLANSNNEKRLPHQWSSNPVEEWAKEQVCQWLLALGMESYITLFMDKTITGAALLNLDSSGLKDLGIKNKDDREKIKKKIKELKAHNDREKKDMEKEKSRREKLLKKAEKAIGKAKK